jgi:hypothetical protein
MVGFPIISSRQRFVSRGFFTAVRLLPCSFGKTKVIKSSPFNNEKWKQTPAIRGMSMGTPKDSQKTRGAKKMDNGSILRDLNDGNFDSFQVAF